ncbi:hypothetical protein SCHPADRAFT_131359 [Schizopora paradoxa]|uniref:F-box domain-containing protein n=1 Tax=Schizopora paradoxa TaxID=27342 RepID=A0A0H2S1D1_9AGAM|nr:hypothetical protein SCHPADRAFT_131359 [Schizopora paradoxa]
MRNFLLSLGTKVATLDLFMIHPLRYEWGVPFSLLFDTSGHSEEHQFPAPTLYKAQLRLNLLRTFLPFLRNIVDLELAVSNRLEASISVRQLLELLALFQNTLEVFTLTNSGTEFYDGELVTTITATHPDSRESLEAPTTAANRVQFPRLSRLKIVSFSECIVHDILFTINCPLIYHLSLAFRTCKCFGQAAPDYVSATMLHRSVPELRSIEIQFDTQLRLTQFNVDLSARHDAFGWLLPKLSSIDMGSGVKRTRHWMDGTPPPLKNLTKLVSSRLGFDTNNIHSLRLHTNIELLPEDVNTLRLLVPEFVK